MLNFIFRSATYYTLWKKFQQEIITVLLSLVVIFIIKSIYDDLFTVLKVSNKDSLVGLLFVNWILIGSVIIYNIYRLKKIKIDKTLTDELKSENKTYTNWNKKSVDLLNKKGELTSMTDVILNRYQASCDTTEIKETP